MIRSGFATIVFVLADTSLIVFIVPHKKLSVGEVMFYLLPKDVMVACVDRTGSS